MRNEQQQVRNSRGSFRLKKILLLITTLLVMLQATGCWGMRELNDIGIITASGFDIDPDGKFRVTVVSVQPQGTVTTPILRSNTWLGTATGKNLREAAKNLRGIATKDLSWLNNLLLIVSQDVARTSMDEVLDFLMRNRELRYTGFILVTEGRAFDMLQVPSDVQRDIAVEIEGLVRNADRWSKTYVPTIREFLVATDDKNTGSVTGRLWYNKTSRQTFSSSKQENQQLYWKNEEQPVAYLSGTAVFKGKKMVGWLDRKETRGYMWITNNIKPGSVVGRPEEGQLVMENVRSKADIKMEIKGENIFANIKLDIRGVLEELTTEHDIRNKGAVQEVEKLFAQAIIDEMKSAVRKAQKEYNCDIFGFGDQIYRKQPEKWKIIEKDWDRLFPLVKVNYDVKVTLRRTGMILKRIF